MLIYMCRLINAIYFTLVSTLTLMELHSHQEFGIKIFCDIFLQLYG